MNVAYNNGVFVLQANEKEFFALAEALLREQGRTHEEIERLKDKHELFTLIRDQMEQGLRSKKMMEFHAP